MSKKFWSVLVFLFLICEINANSQLNIYIRKVVDINNYTIDPGHYPLMKARIRAEYQGQSVKLNKEQVLILENNMIAELSAITDFQSDSSSNEKWQEISWLTRRKGANSTINNQVIMVDSIFITYQNKIGKTIGWFSRMDLSYLNIENYKNEPLTQMKFPLGDPGSSQNNIVILRGKQGQYDWEGFENPIRVDSVKVHTDNFRIKWDGWVADKTPPPVDVWVGMPYYARIYYEPKDNGYHTDKFSVYYEGGLKSEIMLSGHQFHIADTANNLKLLYPNGYETFIPCQEIEIKWKGYIPGMGTYIDFSSNAGASWINIGVSDDSTFIWKTPNVSTVAALIRIRQNFNSSKPTLMKIDDLPVYKIAFNYNGSKLLSANSAGIIRQWNPSKEEFVKNFYLDTPDFPSSNFVTTGLDYTLKDSVFAITYYRTSDRPRKDSIAFFYYSDSIPFLRIGIEQGFNTKRVYFDNQRRFMAFFSQLSNIVKLYSTKDGSFIRDLAFDKPVTAFSFNQNIDEAAVALMNGEIQLLALPNFDIKQKLDYSFFPMILEMSFAPNGKFIAFGCKAPKTTIFSDNRNDVFVANLSSNQVVRRLRRTASDPVGIEFSPASTKLLIGSQAYPQITYWDLPVDNSFSGFQGHKGKLTDFAFSPHGSMIATSSLSSDNLYIRRFTYAESDESNNYFKIKTPSITINNIQIEPAYLGENKNYYFDKSFCVDVTSEFVLDLDSISMTNGNYFRLIKPQPKDTILNPGECLSIHLNFFPLDTGILLDTVVVYTCGKNYLVPVSGRGLPRHINLIRDTLKFEPLCIGSKQEKIFPLAINADPVPVLINHIEIIEDGYTPFLNLNSWNQMVQPGDTIFADISFEPTKIEFNTNKIQILHSEQYKFKPYAYVAGEGIGTDYELSHNDLRFIPEILTREITIKNKSNNDISIEKVIINNPDFFTVLTALPFPIENNGEGKLQIRWNQWNGDPPQDSKATIIAGPCSAEKNISLGLYKGNSTIIIPDVFADPKGNTTIKINYSNTENYPYKGIRPLEGEIILNPRMFLPTSIVCPYGTATLTKNEIQHDRRIVGFKAEGDFPPEGTAVEINGIVGLSEIDTTHINLLKELPYWGKAVQTGLGFGVFHLINIYSDRLVIRDDIITNLTLNPNPSSGKIEIRFNAKYSAQCYIDVYNDLGIIEFQKEFVGVKGNNTFNIDLSQLKSGTYSLIVRLGAGYRTNRVVIIK